MKNSVLIISVLFLGLSMGCQKNDDRAPMEIALQNEPPLSFDLVDVPDKATDVGLTPTLSWESAKNPKGDEVTYNLYLGMEADPKTLLQSDINGTSFEITERLQLITDYYWKVVATDSEGKKSQSSTQKFTTRYYLIPDEPLFETGGFGSRFSHASTVFDNRIWVTGGYDGQVKNDVISTSNGQLYTYHSKSGGFAGFDARYFHKMLTYNNKLWVIGGRKLLGPSAVKEDVWNSEDGLTWTEVISNAAFGGRHAFGATVFDNKMWVIGGSDSSFDYTNDVWYSEDGAIWTLATASTNFSKRSGHVVVTFKDKLWVIGGFDGERKNDVWYSNDGFLWEEATSEADFPARNAHTATVFDDKIWIVGGIVGESGNEANDVWYSDNGIDWIQVQVSDLFPTRAQHTAAVFNDQLWIIGGIGFETYNDIWTLD